jgi:hypothetical protein
MGPWPDADLPLLCLDVGDGELIQKINLPTDRPSARVFRSPAGPALAGGFVADKGPAVRLDRFGLVFGLGRQIRVLDNARPATPKK